MLYRKSSILPKNEQKITIPIISKETAQNSDFFYSFFGRFETIINCFRDFLTFCWVKRIGLWSANVIWDPAR